jgi:hypothetical protein
MSTLTAPALELHVFTVTDYVALAAECFPWMTAEHAQNTGEFYVRMGVGWTGSQDGRPLAAGGVLFPYGTPTLAVAWALWTPRARAWPARRAVHVTMVRHLRRITAHFKPRRLQAEVLADEPRARRWVEALGFTLESTMPAYGPQGQTMETWVWFPA